MRAILALEDGRYFQGQAFGATEVAATGEICFNTSMTGYQEVLTDPSYHGQIVTMTYPLIGNYGVNGLDNESDLPHVRGFVIGELCEMPSNWRSEGSLDAYLKEHGIPGVEGIDTRALTRHLREKGAMKACLTTEETDPEAAVARAAAGEGVVGMDFVREVSAPASYTWDPEGDDSREWTVVGATAPEVQPVTRKIVAYDFGIKRNMLRRLRQEGFGVTVVPAGTPAEEVLALDPDGVFLSNGPGDPAALEYIHREITTLFGKLPIFAICLGHQILGHAFGGKTFKLKFGHRGGNQPVKDLPLRSGLDHLPKPRVRRRSRLAARKRGSHPHQSERPDRGRDCPSGNSRLQCPIPPRSRARTQRRQVFLQRVCQSH